MKLQTPITGAVINVLDKDAQFYVAQGFKPLESQPKKRTTRKTTKKER